MNVSNTDNGKTLDWNSERSSQSYDFVEIKDLKRSRWNEKENFKQTGRVGSGANGNCFLLERRSDRAVRVCKVTQRCMNWGKGTLEEEPLEAKILRDILPPHDRICRLRESIIQPQTTQLYFDFYSDGDLSTLIRQYEHHWETVPETFMWHAFMQLAEALAFTHFGYNRRTSCRPPQEQWTTILHGDIKPANIFLSPPNPDSKDPLCRIYPSLVLGDFGLARLNHAAPFAGTLIFQPPELPATSQKADVWAIGAILHCLAHYDAPVAPPPRGADAESWWWSWEARVPLPLDQYTWELHDCVAAALVIDPRRRMDALQLLKRTERMFEAFVEPFLDRLCEELVDWATYGDMWYDANDCTLSG
ncbi:Serine/threonine-protein kinase Nek2 [Puttea exsequens]|nr:Serine/threonine-protein kinase Nek2 [Puttea exsequens]